MLKTLSFQDFVPYRNAAFSAAEAAGYELELAELTDHSNAQLEQFSLVFTCPALPWLPQGTYTLIHADGTEFVLFMVPIGPEDSTMRYESVFSRFAKNPGTSKQD
jgi:hypothetical protein